MARILVVYGTRYGQTEKIVKRIAGLLEDNGHQVDVRKADRLASGLNLESYHGFLVAASVIAGKHQSFVRRFIRSSSSRLSGAASAFISVSGSAADSPDLARKTAESFLEGTGWQPTLVECFPGAIAYTRYPWWLRWIMRRIAQSHGGPTDTSQDHELTDWEAVDRFAAHFITILETPAPGARCSSERLEPRAPIASQV